MRSTCSRAASIGRRSPCCVCSTGSGSPPASTVVGELLRLLLVLVAVVVFDSVLMAVAALVVGKALISIAQLVAAAHWFRGATGVRLTGPAMGAVDRDERRAVLHTIFHTNLFSYQRLIQNQVPTLLLGAISGATETAIYKVGIAAVGGDRSGGRSGPLGTPRAPLEAVGRRTPRRGEGPGREGVPDLDTDRPWTVRVDRRPAWTDPRPALGWKSGGRGGDGPAPRNARTDHLRLRVLANGASSSRLTRAGSSGSSLRSARR